MKKKTTKQPILTHVLNVILIFLIVECFLCSLMAVRKYARENCEQRIRETTEQAAEMFGHTMEQHREKLTLLADILMDNDTNSPEQIEKYLDSFCATHAFTAVCIHRADGVTASSGDYPAHDTDLYHFETEKRLATDPDQPYISEVIVTGPSRSEQYVFQAVPVEREGQGVVAVLYGYMSLEAFPTMLSTSGIGEKSEFYIVDGDTGNFLMNEYYRYDDEGEELVLGNMYQDGLEQHDISKGYSLEETRRHLQNGEAGYLTFRSARDGKTYYTYYSPLGLNNWSMQMTIEETAAQEDYASISRAGLILMISVIALMVAHVLVLMLQNARVNRLDRQRLHRSNYIGAVQRALINAHNDPDFVDQALRIVGEETEAETVLLLTFSDKVISDAQYWPSTDRPQAMDLVGRNIREDFPLLFDMIFGHTCVVYDSTQPDMALSQSAIDIFAALEVSNMVLVPITDPAGSLKGALAAVNVAGKKDPNVLECVTYDFFMAITNLENHNIIKNMGMIDYLTGVKNRNSYEAEVGGYAVLDRDSLWCVFIDVNGLHEVNNTQGHKAGDLMLSAVAGAIKRVFDPKMAYRLGGDEFVAFVTDSSVEDMMKRKKALKAELSVRGYHVSVGFEGGRKNKDGIFDIDCIIAESETMMYQDKAKYYQEHGLSHERDHSDLRGEQSTLSIG